MPHCTVSWHVEIEKIFFRLKFLQHLPFSKNNKIYFKKIFFFKILKKKLFFFEKIILKNFFFQFFFHNLVYSFEILKNNFSYIVKYFCHKMYLKKAFLANFRHYVLMQPISCKISSSRGASPALYSIWSILSIKTEKFY